MKKILTCTLVITSILGNSYGMNFEQDEQSVNQENLTSEVVDDPDNGFMIRGIKISVKDNRKDNSSVLIISNIKSIEKPKKEENEFFRLTNECIISNYSSLSDLPDNVKELVSCANQQIQPQFFQAGGFHNFFYEDVLEALLFLNNNDQYSDSTKFLCEAVIQQYPNNISIPVRNVGELPFLYGLSYDIMMRCTEMNNSKLLKTLITAEIGLGIELKNYRRATDQLCWESMRRGIKRSFLRLKLMLDVLQELKIDNSFAKPRLSQDKNISWFYCWDDSNPGELDRYKQIEELLDTYVVKSDSGSGSEE